MNPERWQRLEALFERASPLDAEARRAFLDRECGEDAALRAEVEALLAEAERPGETLGVAFRRAVAGDTVATAHDARIGADVGAYRIVRELGRGGMGSVYYATHREYGRPVAVKFLQPGVTSEALVTRFGVERRILANLDHPGIAGFIDAGATAGGAPYLIMEHVEGAPITDYCEQRGLGTRERVKLVRSVCAAVQHAHARLVIHRDLKPGNVLVTKDGSPKLLDFGIAKLLADEAGGDPALTRVGQRALTLEYASPEQVRGEPLSTQTDLYSLGVVLFELLTGERPHELGSLTWDQINRKLEAPPPLPSATGRRRHLAGDLDSIVTKALEPRTAERYASVEELSEDLRRFLEGRAVRARRAGAAYRLRKLAWRHRLSVAAAALLLATLVGGIVTTSLARRRAEAGEALAQERLDQVLEFASTLLFDVHDAVAELKGATPARRLLVQRAVAQLDRLAADNGGDPAVRTHLAAGYEKLSEIQYADGSAHLGDSDGALASLAKALRLREALAAGGGREARRAVAADYSRLADIRSLTRDLPGAETDARRALELYEALWREAPADPESRAELAHALADAADVERKMGANEKALSGLRRALELEQALLAESPADADRRRAVVTTSISLADLHYAAGEPAASLAALDTVLDLARAQVREHPHNAQYQADVASVLNRMGHSAGAQGSHSEALRRYLEGEEIIAALSAADPANARLRRSVAIHGTNVALMMETLGDLAGAEARQRRSLEIHTRLAEADPESVQARDDVAYVQAALASVLLQGARLAPAVELARLAVEARRRLVAEDPTNAESRYRLARAYALAGRIRERQGDGGAACDAYRQAADTLAPVEGQVVVRDQHLGVALEKRAACSI